MATGQVFKPINRDGREQKLQDMVSDKMALHVLLSSPSLPQKYIVFDGVEYWMFHGSMDGYQKGLVSYKGHTHHLRLQIWSVAASLNLPFKIRDISVDVQRDCDWLWGKYQERVVRMMENDIERALRKFEKQEGFESGSLWIAPDVSGNPAIWKDSDGVGLLQCVGHVQSEAFSAHVSAVVLERAMKAGLSPKEE